MMERESRFLEYKDSITGYKQLCKAIVAFRNNLGGKVIIGVKDGTIEVVGLSEEEIDRLIEELPEELQVSKGTVRTRILELMNKGWLKQIGAGPNVKYGWLK
jgi:predicted HTH transcriptional regulator